MPCTKRLDLKNTHTHHDVFLLKKDDEQKMWCMCVCISKIRDEVKKKAKNYNHTHPSVK